MSDHSPLKAMTTSNLKHRGSCCKSGCLHCPYGYTIKKFGIQFLDVTEEKLSIAKEIFQNKLSLDEFSIDDFKLILLKESICGVIRKDKLFVRELYLHADFADQGITKELVESYYFY